MVRVASILFVFRTSLTEMELTEKNELNESDCALNTEFEDDDDDANAPLAANKRIEKDFMSNK